MFGLDRKVCISSHVLQATCNVLSHQHVAGCSRRHRHHVQETRERDAGETKGSDVFVFDIIYNSGGARGFEAPVGGGSEVNTAF
jgi:hypothetical protein